MNINGDIIQGCGDNRYLMFMPAIKVNKTRCNLNIMCYYIIILYIFKL